MLVGAYRSIYKRQVLMVLVYWSRRIRAKVQDPEDAVAQEETAYQKEREQPTSRPAEEPQPTVLPASTRHYTLILPSNPSGEQPPKEPLAYLGLQSVLCHCLRHLRSARW